MNTRSTDVIIVGKGISGLVLSVLLTRKGIDHLILNRTDKRREFALAETLPPSTLALLETLNLRELFEESSFKKTFGYHSLWGTKQVVDTNFFFHHPYKYGLKLNKQKLLRNLTIKAKSNIIEFDKSFQLTLSEGNVCVRTQQQNTPLEINAKLIVDATGRNRAVLKQLNIESDYYDHLIASSCHLPKVKHDKLKHEVFVESFENGWGIVSALNESTNVITVFTKKGNTILPRLKEYENWKTALSETSILKDFLVDNLNPKVIGGDANSSKATKVTGSNWLALGDAAISFDPLSSHGISNALYCAKTATVAIESFLESNSAFPLEQYENTLHLIFDEYLKNKTKLYAAEKRWKGSAFWN
jgi:flavin-dependent dehydrogenase